MADKTYVAVIQDDHEVDVRDPDVITVAPLDVERETILDTEGITHDNIGIFASAPGFTVDRLIGIAEAAADYRRAVARGQSLEWLAESSSALDDALVSTGFLDEGELEEDFD